jgi:hypothetical protein
VLWGRRRGLSQGYPISVFIKSVYVETKCMNWCQGAVYPPDSDFFNRCKNTQKAIKLFIWAWQLIEGKFNFEISKFNLNWMPDSALFIFRTTGPDLYYFRTPSKGDKQQLVYDVKTSEKLSSRSV